MHQEAKFNLHIITLNSDPATTKRARTWWNFHNSSLRTLFAICLCVSGENKNETTNSKSAQNSEALGEGLFCDAPPRTTESKKHPFYFYPETSWLKCASAVETRNIAASETKKFVSIYRMTRYFSSNIEL